MQWNVIVDVLGLLIVGVFVLRILRHDINE